MQFLIFINVKYFGAIIGVVLLLLLGVSFPFSLLIIGVTWLVVYMVAKSNTVDDQSQNEYNAPDKKEITNSTQFPQPSAWAKKEEPLDQSVTPTSHIHEESYSENSKDNNKLSAYTYHSGTGTYNGSAIPRSEIISFAQRSEVSDIADKQDIVNIVQSIANHKNTTELDIKSIQGSLRASIVVSEEVKRAVGNLVYSLLEHKKNKDNSENKISESVDIVSVFRDLKRALEDLTLDVSVSIGCENDETESVSDDDSIIDVTGEYHKLGKDVKEIESEQIHSPKTVPYWDHSYIYSTNHLKWNASDKVRRFYADYKDAFLNGTYYNLNGNTNYSFTLMYDLLDEYEKGKDLTFLTRHIQALIKHYPETESYAERNLIDKAKSRTSKNRDETTIQDLVEFFPNYVGWSFIDLHSKELELSKEEISILSYIETRYGLFYARTELVQLKIIQLFRHIRLKLVQQYTERGLSINNGFKSLLDTIDFKVRSGYDYSTGKPTYSSISLREKINETYSWIFGHCRNKFYDRYRLRNSETSDTFTYLEKSTEYKTIALHLRPIIDPIIESYFNSQPEFTEEEEIAINSSYNARWRYFFKEITDSFEGNLPETMEHINKLIDTNSKNYGLNYLLFDTSKFLVGKDDTKALKMYLRYIDAYRKFSSDTEKPLPKYICKKLFKKQEHQDEFEQIVRQYKCDKDQIKAYEAIDQLFLPKRKKLQLDQNEISKIAEQHSETVLLLNEVMEEGEVAIIDTKPKQDITVPNSDTATSDLQTNALLDSLHLELLDIFVINDYSLAKAHVEDFAKSKGLMANRLIDKINELCYETLDDVLIEDENDRWTIMGEYLKKIVA